MALNLNIVRGTLILLTQLPLILLLGAEYDLLFGFNHTEHAFTILVFLFAAPPLLNLSWLIGEFVLSVRGFRRHTLAVLFRRPMIAGLFLGESIAIDLYILSMARM